MIMHVSSSRMNSTLLTLIISSLLVVGCSAESEPEFDGCLQQDLEYAQEIMELDEAWTVGLENLANSEESSAALAKPTNELMTLKKNMVQLDPPSCAVDDQEAYIEAMELVIGLYQDKVGDPGQAVDLIDMDSAAEQMRPLRSRFGGEWS